MKNITRIPVVPTSILVQAVRLFDELRMRGNDAAIIVPDCLAADTVKKVLNLTDKHVLDASMPRLHHWMTRRAFPVYVIADEVKCAAEVHQKFAGEGRFIHLLAQRQATFPKAHIYSFTEARKRVTTDTQTECLQ